MKKLIAKIARLIKTVINGMCIDILRNKRRYEKEKTMVEKKLRLLKILSFFLIL